MSQNTQPATPQKAKKASKNKKRALHRRLRQYPQEYFENSFGRQLAYPPGPNSQQLSTVPSSGSESSVQDPEEMLYESTDRISGDEIASRLGGGIYFTDVAMTTNLYYSEGEPFSGTPYSDIHHGTRVGDTSNTNYNYGNTAQFEMSDDHRPAADGSASYALSMGFPPYPTDVGIGPSTSWSGPQTTMPFSPSAPQGTFENSVQVQNVDFNGEHSNTGGWSIPLDFLVPMEFAENMPGGGYGEYHGPSTWPDSNENFD